MIELVTNASAIDFGNLRFLIVDDERDQRYLLARTLAGMGTARVLEAPSGNEALAILDDATTEGFDCVLMDVQMPVMDGFECTAIIRERERRTHAHLPIIAMTAHAMKGDEERCLAAGMDGYLSKPLHPDDFFDVVERHMTARVGAQLI